MDLYNAAASIFDPFILELPVRMMGIRITNLHHNAGQLPLFKNNRITARSTSVMDEVNSMFGDFKICFVSVIETEEENRGSRVISPSWRPYGIRNINLSFSMRKL